jgi:prepilin-type N-terminal cleavage/methylation domain-containing protein
MTPSRRARAAAAVRLRRRGFTLVEVIIALAILGGVLLGLSDYTRRFTVSTRRAASNTEASDIAAAQLETVKGWRNYGTLVATYHQNTVTFATGAWSGFTRETFAVRTGPTATADFVTVTVVVTGRGLATPMRKTTMIAAF